MPLVVKRTLKMVYVEVSLVWRRAGEITVNVAPGKQEISNIWMPYTPRSPGIYRISINQAVGRAIYIGEGASVSRRLGAYTRAYAEEKSTTEARLSREIRAALTHGRAVLVDTATAGNIDLTEPERALDMNNVAERRFAEAAAVLAEAEQDADGQITILNRIFDDYWYLSD